ncbi:MAG TPA: DinB family protein [Chitinophagaceae bacterium]|jgi:hypothetical protein|nr:DinB family protein [Chitinophagaceae bacterium]
MFADKIEFLKNGLVPLLRSIPLATPPRFGKMTLQQMTEHFTDSVRVASGRLANNKVVTPEDQLPRMLAFLMSDKPFPQGIANPLLSEVPAPVRNKDFNAALDELDAELGQFFARFEANPHLTTIHPYFGVLNFEENVQAMYKHAEHHLRQFGVEG